MTGSTNNYRLRVLVELKVRSGPGKNYNEIKRLNYGDVVSAYEKKSDGSFVWYKIGDNRWIGNDRSDKDAPFVEEI